MSNLATQPSLVALPSTHSIITVTITPPATLTNLGALLTPVSLPPACIQSLYDMKTTGLGISDSQSFFTQGCALSSCCPSSKPYTTGYGWLSSYYSPAVCPVSYQTCPGPAEITPTKVGETVAFCCPEEFLCPGPIDNNVYAETWYACFSTVTSSSSVIQIDNLFDQNTVGTSVISTVTGANYHDHYAVVAYPLQIRWGSGDFATATSIPGGGTNSTGNGNGNRLQKGAIARIVVGAVLGGLAALVLLYWFIRQQRHARAQFANSSREPEVPLPEALRYNKTNRVAVYELNHPKVNRSPVEELDAHDGPVADLPTRTQTPESNGPPRRRFPSGWQFGVKSGIAIITSALIVNLTILVLSSVGFPVSGGLSTVFTGDCSTTRSYSLWGHLGINLLGTMMLSASNYCQQCLCAPTRADVDRAHRKKDWVDIGIPSFRNLWCGRLTSIRVTLWWLLAISSIPIHWIYNSAIFESLAGQMYAVVVVSEEFITGPAYTPFVQPYGNIDSDRYDIFTTNQSLLEIRSVMNSFERLSPSDCAKAYGVQVPSSRRDVIVVVDAPSYSVPFGNPDLTSFHYNNPNTTNSVLHITSSEYGLWIYGANSYDWMFELAGVFEWFTTLEANFTIYDPKVQYCLSEVVPQRCQFTVNIYILAVVIALDLVKLACMLATIRIVKQKPFFTIGDALSSFLNEADPTTAGMCTWTKSDFVKGNWSPQPRPWMAQRCRRYSALSLKRWLFCNSLYCITLGTVLGLICFATIKNQISATLIMTYGFGQIQSKNLLSNIQGLVVNILLANLPQIILSFVYLMYNAAFTAICVTNEYSRFSKVRKTLRVSNPKGNQRSSFYLSLPYRYAIPIISLSGALHWFISQSLFLVKINVYDPQNTHLPNETLSLVPAASISVCGFSVMPMIATLVLGGSMVIVLNGFGLSKLKGDVPTAASCSAAISAACHGNDGVNGVMFGKMATNRTGQIGHLCFSGDTLESPVRGEIYS